jgi:hypothetical protein
MHSWTVTHFNRLLGAYQASVKREAPGPQGAPLDFVHRKHSKKRSNPNSADVHTWTI